MNFYNIFIKLCNDKNVKPVVAAKEIGISKSNVSNWKCRNTQPTDANLQKIADYFGVSVEYFKKEEQPPEIGELSENEELFKVFSALPEERQQIVANLIRTLSKDL